MRSILKSRWTMGTAAAAIATLGFVATTTTADAAWCANWRYGHCVDWRYNSYNYYNPGPTAALNAFAGVMGAAVAASQPRYYYPPPAYYYPAPSYGYYPPSYGYYGPEPGYGLVIR